MSKFTDEQRAAAIHMVARYEQRIQQIWDDEVWVLEAQLNLEEGEVEELLHEVY